MSVTKRTAAQMSYNIAKNIYYYNKQYVDAMVRAGKFTAEQANSEFGRRVAKELAENGLKVPAKFAAAAAAGAGGAAVVAAGAGGGATAGGGLLAGAVAVATGPVGVGVAACAAIGTIGYCAYKYFNKK